MPAVSLADQISRLPNVAATIADSLAHMIFTGGLRPGERLVQARLAEQFGVSRLPVRDALHILEQRSLVVTRPRRGVVVRPVSRRGVHDIFAVRVALEPTALEEVVQGLTAADLSYLSGIVRAQDRAVQRGDMVEATALDQRFHDYLNSLVGNALLREMLQILWARNRQIRSVVQVSDRGKEIGRRSVARHRGLLDALRGRDCARAKELTIQTAHASEEEILEEMERLGWFEENE
jgi:DNA-binding GntR family transcriptional regulator